ncbi:MAG TPA: hypothetical protein PKY87_00950 [Terricaulis sp.]|nr:hypothetical protein [Terricaulis sp.]
MATRKTVPLSVRVSDDDAAFLASLEIAGAATPSEKLRAILAHTRQRAEGVSDEAEGAEAFRASVRPSERRLRAWEIERGMRSDLVRKLYDRVPEMMATLAAGPSAQAARDGLPQFEDRLSIQAYALVEDLLELALASTNRAYDPDRLSTRVMAAFDVIDRVKAPAVKKKGVKS